MVYFDTIFVNKQTFDLDMHKQVMESKFLVELNNSPLYKELLNLTRFLEWLDFKVSYVVFNWIQWLEVFYPQKGFKVHWTMEMMELSNKVVEWAKFTQIVF
jgi:hypothetical protein